MTETKEQMTDLMAMIQLPEEGIRQLLDAREQLEKEGHWDVIVQTAEQVMTADGELSVLTKTLEETEGREETFGVNRYLLDALMLFCCWEEVKVRYEKQGLPMDVFDKSLEDMKWKMLECYEIHGVYGNFVGHWYDGFFNLTRFGLGRLQFELRPFEGKEDCEVDGVQIHPGDTVINMHIPSAGPMKPELLDDAFARAEVFFKEHFPKDYTVFGVESWLDRSGSGTDPSGRKYESVCGSVPSGCSGKKRDDFPGWLEGIRRRVEEETGRTSPEDRAAESDCRLSAAGRQTGKWLWHICPEKINI